MAATQPVARPICCDGCSMAADAEHLRRRIARLEWASRFRPIRISTLFLTLAPPSALEDFFYHPSGVPHEPYARALFEDLMAVAAGSVGPVGAGSAAEAEGEKGTGESDSQSTRAGRETGLAAFQRRGFFLASWVECPLEEIGPDTDVPTLLSQLAPTLILRIDHSYRPQAILLLGDRLAAPAKRLTGLGFDRRLLRAGGAALPLPGYSDGGGRKRFRGQLASLIVAD